MLTDESSIGIVTISYNQSKYLEECITSVISHREKFLSYIIVDPGSTDGSREIIENYRERGCFFDVVLEKDQGPADGLNKGFSKFPKSVKIYGYINSDDKLCPWTIKFVVEYFRDHPDVDILLGAGVILDQNGKQSWRKQLSTSFTPQRHIDRIENAVQQATFFRADLFHAVGGFNVENKTCWDTELLVDLVLAGGKVAVINKVLGCFRIYPGTITHTMNSDGPNQARAIDIERCRNKVLAKGYRESRFPINLIKRIWYRVDPRRRIAEYLTQ